MKIKEDIERAIAISESAKNQHLKLAEDFRNDEEMFLVQAHAALDFERAEKALRSCLRWCS